MITIPDDDYNRRTISDQFDYTYDLINSVCGDLLGEGQTRLVYQQTMNTDFVIKVAKKNSWDNIREYEFYWSASDEMRKWLAKPTWISENGFWMFQEKVERITEKNKKNIPKEIPIFLGDVKFENFGFIGKRFVACDYAQSNFLAVDKMNIRFKKFKSHLGEKL